MLLRNIKNMFSISDLRRKLFFTFGVLVVYRFGCHIPVIGINVARISDVINQTTNLGKLLNFLDLFTGGSLAKCTLFGLGIGPYITASIMMQILGFTVPYFEQLVKEGDYGKKLINQYTRYLALALSVMYAIGFSFALESEGLVLTPGWGFRFLFVLSLAVGCTVVMWLGEQISLFGIGNGSSMIIFASIVARLPDNAARTLYLIQQGNLDAIIGTLVWLIFIGLTACVIFLEKGERKIPVQYARRVIGNRIYGGQSTYIPFKINNAGVMPVIFTQTIMSIPTALITLLAGRHALFSMLAEKFSYTGFLYNSMQFILIIFFYYFYTAFAFNPIDLSENIKKNGGFIPGIRPGRKTAEFFDMILTRLGLVGAIYLALLALAPNILAALINNMPLTIGGTSLLIMVGVGLETSAQIESYLLEHNYDGFLSTGRMKLRGSR